MKIKVDHAMLAEMLAGLKSIKPKRSMIPSVQSYHLETEGKNTLKVRVTDLDVQVSGVLPATVQDWGACLLPPEAAEVIFKTKPKKGVEAEIQITDIVDGKLFSVEVRTEAQKFKFSSIDPDEFPPPPKPTYPEGAKVVKSTAVFTRLAEAIGKALVAAATEDTRPVLTHVLIDNSKPMKARLAAADGFRLNVATILRTGKCPSLLVSTEAARFMNKFTEQPIAVSTVESTVCLSGSVPNAGTITHHQITAVFGLPGSIELAMRNFEGTFPNYTQLIPKPASFKHRLLVSKAEALEAVTTLLKAYKHATILRLVGHDKRLTMSINDDQGQPQSVTVPCTGEVKIAVNPHYFVDALRLTEAEVVLLKTTTPSAPMLFESEDLQQILMPMFVQWPEVKKKARSPIEAMVDKACGIPDGPPLQDTPGNLTEEAV